MTRVVTRAVTLMTSHPELLTRSVTRTTLFVIGCDQIDRTLKSIRRSDQLKSAVATKNGLVSLYDQITGYGNSNTKQMQ